MSSSISSGPVQPEPGAGGEASRRRRGRLVALGLLALAAAPFVAALVAYLLWEPGKQTNYGELITPEPLPEAPLALADGRPFHLSQLKGKWVLLHIDGAGCGADCREKLLYSRQVRLALGKDASRLERLWLIDDSAPLDPGLEREYRGTGFARAAGSPLLAHFPAAHDRREHIYLIDPLGNLMLRYPRHPDPSRMRKDLERLLRAAGGS